METAVFIQRGLVRCAVARIGKGRQASVCQGVSWPGWLRCGAERLGKVRQGEDCLGAASPGKVALWQGEVRPGKASYGRVRRGRPRYGKVR